MKKPTGSKSASFKRTGRARGVGELVNKLIDPALKKRGFASRDMLENWQVIAPPPYNRTTVPDRLKWRRNEAGGQGAILYLRCREGDRMALSHDHERISSAINRYFGYVLVDAIKLSLEPFTDKQREISNPTFSADPAVVSKVNEAISKVEDSEIKDALKGLGLGLLGKKEH